MENSDSSPNEQSPTKYVNLAAEYVLQNGQKSKLINSSDNNFRVELKTQTIEFDITADFYITKIHFAVEHVDIGRFSLRYIDWYTNSEKNCIFSTTESDENRLTFEVGRTIRRLILHYDKGFLDWSKPRLFGMSIIGIPISKLEPYFQELVDSDAAKQVKLDEIVNREAKLKKEREALDTEKNAFESQKATLEKQISTAKKVVEELEVEIESLKNDKEAAAKELEAEVSNLSEQQGKLSHMQTTLSQLESDIATKATEKTNLSEEISKIQTELRSLKKTFATYTNEYASFNKQSNWYIVFYSVLLSFPICVLGYVFYRLFDGAAALATIYQTQPNISTQTIFLTRLPFVTIAWILIHGSYVIFKLISLKIMDIQSEKLALSKIAIIAQDVVNLSSEALNLSDEQIQDTNIYLRMELVKAHLKETIGKDYEYKIRDNSILDSIRETIASKIMPFKWRTVLEKKDRT